MFRIGSALKRRLTARLIGGACFLPLLLGGLELEGCPTGDSLVTSDASYYDPYGYSDWDYYGDGADDNWSHTGYGGSVGGDGETFYFIDGDSSYISGP